MKERRERARRRLSDHFATLAQLVGVGQFGWTVATIPISDVWSYGAATAVLVALELVAVYLIILGEEG